MAAHAHVAALRALPTRFYKRKVVRDLLWSVTSPHLIDGALFPVLPVGFGLDAGDAHTAHLHDWLAALEADPAHLVAFLHDANTATRKALALGVYFASLLEYWLRHCPLLCVTQFERGKQIISASNQTLGQLKFLFRVRHNHDAAAEFDDYHVESSVKFFLLHPLNEQFQHHDDDNAVRAVAYPLEQFVGPHLGENLAWRVQEVARKLDLCRGGSVQHWLRERYSDHVASWIVLRGYLFYPLHQFESTSQVLQNHDWQFHRNPSSNLEDSTPQVRHNPQIGPDHLRGWWASDLEHEFASRVRANDVTRLGESRFVVLPKLHWLTPLLAEETDGHVVVQGEDQLHIETVPSVSLDELLALARSHFATLADSREAKAKGGVVMPLLVAEIVRCQPSDLEYEQSVCRWKELSRGFLLDPKSWDPMPLCHEPVRFKRTNEDSSNDRVRGEREYEGRPRECVHDGVIKPTDQEAELLRQSKLHAFVDPNTVTPASMCDELLVILARDQKRFTHNNLKQSVQSVLATRARGESCFLLESLQVLVLGDFDQVLLTDESKLVQRVAHLLLDAFEGRNSPTVDDEMLLQFVGLFDAVACDETRWNYINLSLRAIDIHLQASPSSLDTNDVFHTTVKRLLDKRLARWNAVAVEIVSVVYANSSSEISNSMRHSTLTTLLDQHDWKHAEQLATSCCHSDVQLLRVLFQQFQTLNMTKPMKRLRKAISRLPASHGFQLMDAEGSHAMHFQHAQGPPVDTDANRAQIAGQIPPLKWTLADTPKGVDEILTQLQRAIEDRPQQPTIVGLDCEWRPQFLFKENAVAATPVAIAAVETEGVSVYQIAFRDLVYVVDVQQLGAAAVEPLDFIWHAPRGAFLLVGFCVAEDLRRLHQSFPSLLLAAESPPRKRLIELKHMALYRQLPAGPWGLSQLYDVCFQEPVDKEEQCSDWGLRPLSENQLQYAARDAYAVRNLALHLLMDVASTKEDDLLQYVERFAVTHSGEPDAALGPWLPTTLAPLDESHVRAALIDFGLVDTAQSLFAVPRSMWEHEPRRREGLVVKTIAVMLRRGGHTLERGVVHYAAVVLHVEFSIDMAALAAHFHVHKDDLQLADPETLLRVFGYPRGAIGPIGLRQQHAVHVVLDAALLKETALLPGAGHEELTYAIPPRVLAETVGASVIALTGQAQLHT